MQLERIVEHEESRVLAVVRVRVEPREDSINEQLAVDSRDMLGGQLRISNLDSTVNAISVSPRGKRNR